MSYTETVSAFAAYGQAKKKKVKRLPKGSRSSAEWKESAMSRQLNENASKTLKPMQNGNKLVQKSKKVNKEVTHSPKTPKPTNVPATGSSRKKRKRRTESNITSPLTVKREKHSVCNNENENESSNENDQSVFRCDPDVIMSPSTSAEQRDSPCVDPPANDSIEDGKQVFQWIISHIDFDNFFAKYWEKKPCLIHRNDSAYFAKLISCAAIDQMLSKNHVEFTKNIDVTSYENGVRKTLNPDGRAIPSTIWPFYEDGCSIRLLNPQTFLQPIYVMNAALQEFFHCMVGTNAYLTPPNSQGFAPHYDDIEAFVLQIEGEKRWKLYNHRAENEKLARFSSLNFSQEEIGEPILDEVLKPGDVLYFPRGTIHQACTLPGHHSLHITLSVYQKHSFADLFEILIPKMLSRAIEKEVDLRRGLPLDIWYKLGKSSDGDDDDNEREEILGTIRKLMTKVLSHSDMDEAVDLMAKKFQHDALPPALTSEEKNRTIFGVKNLIDRNGKVKYGYEITLDTHVRLLRANILRIVEENDTIRVYYYVDNSKEYHEYEENYIEIDEDGACLVRQLLHEYPDYICTSELEADSDDMKLSVVQGLYERGLLMVDEPMQ